MTFQFKRAVRENVGLLIGLIGASGSGKTYTAMRLASGICGDKPFAVIDTEAGRAKHYADAFKFDHGDLAPPFSPSNYADAIKAADAAGYPVIIVDSASHEHAGEGGILDMQEKELDRMAGEDWKKREAVRMASWIKPKMEHKKMVQRLLQVRAHLILCFRAEEKVEMIRDDNGKMKVVPKASPTGLHGWTPITEKNLPYELTCSFLLTADHPGVPKPIKLQEQHRKLFPLDKPITEESGKRLAEWASGGVRETKNPPQASASNTQQASPSPGVAPAGDHAGPLAPTGRFNWEEAGELGDVLPDAYDRALVSYSQASSVIHIKQADAIAKTISEESKLASLREHRKAALVRIQAKPVAEERI